MRIRVSLEEQPKAWDWMPDPRGKDMPDDLIERYEKAKAAFRQAERALFNTYQRLGHDSNGEPTK